MYQFVHLETYARKSDAKGRSVSYVLDEAERKPDACQHVENPRPPELVHGMPLADLRALHDERAASATTPNGRGQHRKIRVDQHSLATVVASYPGGDPDDPADPAEVEKWERLTLAWLRERYGDALASVVRHVDEAHPHLHAYVLPDGEMKARSYHPGVAAKQAAKAAAVEAGQDAKTANATGDRAYKQAMRQWQDSYWQSVGLPCGLARLGPGRRRLSRDAWKAEQAQVQHAAAISSAADQATGKGRAIVAAARRARDEAIAAAEAAKADADAARLEADRARRQAGKLVGQAKSEARQIVQKAALEATRLRKLGEKLGGVWSGLAGVQRRLEARADERVKLAQDKARLEVEQAKVAIRGELGGEMDRLRQSAENANILLKAQTERLRVAEEATRAAKAEASREKNGRLAAIQERDVFRGRWADADNALAATKKTHRL